MTILKHKTVGPDLDRTEWEGDDTHEIDGVAAGEVIVVTVPPTGMKKVLNLYYDPATGNFLVELED